MDLIVLDRNNNILDKFSNKFFSNLEYEEVLNGVGTGKFNMTIENSNNKFNYLKVNNRFIFVDDNNKILFGGLLYKIVPSYDLTNTFYFKNLLGIFNDKILYADKNYSNKTVKEILEDLLLDINNRENLKINLDCNIEDVIADKNYKKGDIILNIITDLLENKYEFTVKPSLNGINASFTLIVKNTIGIDRTLVNNDYVEFKYILNEGSKRSIDTITGDIDIRNTGNAIIGVNDSNYDEREDITSIANIGRIERRFNSKGDITNETIAYLEDRKDIINIIDVIPIAKDYNIVDIGDLVKIITSGNKYLELNAGIKVIGKSFTLGDLIEVKIKLSNTKIKQIGFIEEINNLKQKTIEL